MSHVVMAVRGSSRCWLGPAHARTGSEIGQEQEQS